MATPASLFALRRTVSGLAIDAVPSADTLLATAVLSPNAKPVLDTATDPIQLKVVLERAATGDHAALLAILHRILTAGDAPAAAYAGVQLAQLVPTDAWPLLEPALAAAVHPASVHLLLPSVRAQIAYLLRAPSSPPPYFIAVVFRFLLLDARRLVPSDPSTITTVSRLLAFFIHNHKTIASHHEYTFCEAVLAFLFIFHHSAQLTDKHIAASHFSREQITAFVSIVLHHVSLCFLLRCEFLRVLWYCRSITGLDHLWIAVTKRPTEFKLQSNAVDMFYSGIPAGSIATALADPYDHAKLFWIVRNVPPPLIPWYISLYLDRFRETSTPYIIPEIIRWLVLQTGINEGSRNPLLFYLISMGKEKGIITPEIASFVYHSLFFNVFFWVNSPQALSCIRPAFSLLFAFATQPGCVDLFGEIINTMYDFVMANHSSARLRIRINIIKAAFHSDAGEHVFQCYNSESCKALPSVTRDRFLELFMMFCTSKTHPTPLDMDVMISTLQKGKTFSINTNSELGKRTLQIDGNEDSMQTDGTTTNDSATISRKAPKLSKSATSVNSGSASDTEKTSSRNNSSTSSNKSNTEPPASIVPDSGSSGNTNKSSSKTTTTTLSTTPEYTKKTGHDYAIALDDYAKVLTACMKPGIGNASKRINEERTIKFFTTQLRDVLALYIKVRKFVNLSGNTTDSGVHASLNASNVLASVCSRLLRKYLSRINKAKESKVKDSKVKVKTEETQVKSQYALAADDVNEVYRAPARTDLDDPNNIVTLFFSSVYSSLVGDRDSQSIYIEFLSKVCSREDKSPLPSFLLVWCTRIRMKSLFLYSALDEKPFESSQEALVFDLQIIGQDVKLLYSMIPQLYSSLDDSLLRCNPKALMCILATLDPLRLYTLVTTVAKGEIILFTNDFIRHVWQTLSWPHFEQSAFWDLFTAHCSRHYILNAQINVEEKGEIQRKMPLEGVLIQLFMSLQTQKLPSTMQPTSFLQLVASLSPVAATKLCNLVSLVESPSGEFLKVLLLDPSSGIVNETTIETDDDMDISNEAMNSQSSDIVNVLVKDNGTRCKLDWSPLFVKWAQRNNTKKRLAEWIHKTEEELGMMKQSNIQNNGGGKTSSNGNKKNVATNAGNLSKTEINHALDNLKEWKAYVQVRRI